MTGPEFGGASLALKRSTRPCKSFLWAASHFASTRLPHIKDVGDASLGEWDEWAGYAFHVRRRLSAQEQALVGDVLDIRGTPEARQRLHKVRRIIERIGSPAGIRLMCEEAGTRVF